MLNQDDLLLLHHLRAAFSGDQARIGQSKEALTQEPGRAAGQVACWALSRTTDHLKRFGRRGWAMEQGIVPNAQEVRLLQMIRAIKAYDKASARQAAEWLVASEQVDTLIDRASPLMAFYGASPVERRTAATA